MAKDSFEDAAVTNEAPPKIQYADGQADMNAAMVNAIKFPETRAAKEQWTVATDQLQRIARKTKGQRKS